MFPESILSQLTSSCSLTEVRVLPLRKTWLAPKSDESEPVSISDLLLCWLTETWFDVSEMPSPQTASTAEAFSDGEWVLPCRMTECGGSEMVMPFVSEADSASNREST